MENLHYIVLSVLVMAATTYLVRMLPLVLFRKKIENPFLQRFLFLIPYAVLAAMTIPAVFSSTGSALSAAAGFTAALVVSFCGKGLLPVAVSACCAALAAELLMRTF